MVEWWWFVDFAAALTALAGMVALTLFFGIGKALSEDEDVARWAYGWLIVSILIALGAGAYVSVASRAEKPANPEQVEAPPCGSR